MVKDAQAETLARAFGALRELCDAIGELDIQDMGTWSCLEKVEDALCAAEERRARGLPVGTRDHYERLRLLTLAEETRPGA